MLQYRLFVAVASRSGFGAAVSEAVARSSIVFCNSVSANCIGTPASRLLGAAAACAILLSFAAEDRKSYWKVWIFQPMFLYERMLSIHVHCCHPVSLPKENQAGPVHFHRMAFTVLPAEFASICLRMSLFECRVVIKKKQNTSKQNRLYCL